MGLADWAAEEVPEDLSVVAVVRETVSIVIYTVSISIVQSRHLKYTHTSDSLSSNESYVRYPAGLGLTVGGAVLGDDPFRLLVAGLVTEAVDCIGDGGGLMIGG